MLRAWTLVIAALLFFSHPASAQGLLQRIRGGQNSNPSGVFNGLNNNNNNSSASSQDNGLDDEGYGALVLVGLFAATSPFWLPPLIVEDDYQQAARFSPYPYSRVDSAYINVDGTRSDAPYGDPDFLQPWSASLQIENGNDFNGLNRLGVRGVFDTSTRFGVRSNWDWYQENLGNGRTDETVLGDTELTFRFAQSDWLRMYAGAGFRAMEDRQTDRWGFNFTYGADIFPVWPLIISTSVDLGDLGEAFVVEARGTAGWGWRNGELFFGYDFRRIGTVNLQGLLGGFRLWF
jgi:hypothetical protein